MSSSFLSSRSTRRHSYSSYSSYSTDHSSSAHRHEKFKLGEGSFGCVIRGPFVMSSNPYNRKFYREHEGDVTKLMLDKREFRNEIENTLIANKLDKGTSSILIHGYNILDRHDLRTILKKNRNVLRKIKDCEIIIKNIEDADEIYQIIYSKVGINLEILYQYFSHFDVRKLLLLCMNLVQGIDIYRRHSFAHIDVKPNNIIYLPQYDKMVFIDYGLAGNYNRIDIDMFENLKYIYTPPEIIAYHIIKYKSSNTDNAFKRFKREYENSLAFTFHFFKELLIYYAYDNSKEIYEKELYNLFITMYYKDEYELEEYVKSCYKYIDAHKLCFTIMELLEVYKYRKAYPKIVDKFYYNVLIKVAYIDPKRRHTTQALLRNYKVFMRQLRNSI